jgi:uncharacterized protein YlaI
MTDERLVLIVLTGDNELLKSEPPSFATLPPGQIRLIANSIAETPLDIALGFLRQLEVREQAANLELRAIKELRRKEIRAYLKDRATERVDKTAARGADGGKINFGLELVIKEVVKEAEEGSAYQSPPSSAPSSPM